MKHITIQAATLDQFDKVLVRVTAQTHKGYNFGGNYGFDTRKFRASNGLILGSNMFPAKDTDDQNVIWLQGNGPADKQGTTIPLTKAKFEKLKVAVNEYNAYYAAAPVCPAAPVRPCVITVG